MMSASSHKLVGTAECAGGHYAIFQLADEKFLVGPFDNIIVDVMETISWPYNHLDEQLVNVVANVPHTHSCLSR
jgi:hypothetical protein